jgi:hypothetical protein
MTRFFKIHLTAEEVASCTVLEGIPPVFKWLQKYKGERADGKIAYSDVFGKKASELTPDNPSFAISSGFKPLTGGRKRVYLECEHVKKSKTKSNTISFQSADLKPDHAIDLEFEINCVGCLKVEAHSSTAPPAQPAITEQASIQAMEVEIIPHRVQGIPAVNFRAPHSATDLLCRLTENISLNVNLINNICANSEDGMKVFVENEEAFFKTITDAWKSTVEPELAAYRAALEADQEAALLIQEVIVANAIEEEGRNPAEGDGYQEEVAVEERGDEQADGEQGHEQTGGEQRGEGPATKRAKNAFDELFKGAKTNPPFSTLAARQMQKQKAALAAKKSQS